MKANIFHLITCSGSVMASLPWCLSTLCSSECLLLCHLHQAQKEKRLGLTFLKMPKCSPSVQAPISLTWGTVRPLNIWECLRLQLAHGYTKVCEQSLILPRPILAAHLPGSPFHTGFGTEALPAEHFYSELTLPLWYEWTGQCSCTHKIPASQHWIPEWRAINQGML